MIRKSSRILSILFLMLFIGWLLQGFWSSAFGGVRVIDKDTGKPIEGAFLIRTWYITVPTLAGGNEYFHDIGISISDEDGEFSQSLGNYFHLYIPFFYDQFEYNSSVYKPGYNVEPFDKKNDLILMSKVPTIARDRMKALEKMEDRVRDVIIKSMEIRMLGPVSDRRYKRQQTHCFEKNRIETLCDVMEKEEEFYYIAAQGVRIKYLPPPRPAVVSMASAEGGRSKSQRNTGALKYRKADYCNIQETSVDELLSLYRQAEDDQTRICIIRKVGRTNNPKAVEPLVDIRCASGKNPVLRHAAEEALISLKPYSKQAIIALLNKNSDTFAYLAVNGLKGLRPVEAIPDIIKLMDNDHSTIGGQAQSLLAEMNPEAVEPLINALKSENPRVRAAAAHVLGKIGNPQAAEPLINALADNDRSVRAKAARALKRCGGEQRRKTLFTVYQNETDPEVKKAIESVLFKNVSPQVVPYLKKYLSNGSLLADQYTVVLDTEDQEQIAEELRSAPAGERKKIMFALAWFGSDWAVEQLADMIHQPADDLRRSAIRALGYDKNEKAVYVLTGILHDHENLLRVEAIYSLGIIRNPIAINALLEMLHDDSPFIRRAAAASLTNFGSPAIAPLLEMLHQNDIYLKWRAAWILGHLTNPLDARGAVRGMVQYNAEVIQDDRVIDALIEALNDPSPEVRWTAIHSLGYIRHPKAIRPLIQILNDSDSGIRLIAVESLKMITGFDGRDDFHQWTKWLNQSPDRRLNKKGDISSTTF